MRKILLIDDDSELRDALQTALTAHGHAVFCAEDGIAALRAAVEIKPELIISDVNMPLLEGPDAVRILKALPMFTRVPVILMSGADLSPTRQADATVRKPVTAERLLELIGGVTWPTASLGAPSRSLPMRATAQDEGWDRALAIASLGQRSNTECADRICRGIELMRAQAFRTGLLRSRGISPADSERLYDRLVESVATLVQLLPFC